MPMIANTLGVSMDSVEWSIKQLSKANVLSMLVAECMAIGRL
jgi:hypothetical protein